MIKKILFFIIFAFTLNCSQKSQDYISFIPELRIGENEVNGSWFGDLTAFYVGPKENIYCLDGQERKIIAFDKQGKFLYDFGQEGKGPGEFLYPNGIVVSSIDTSIYIFDSGHRNISKFTMNGTYIKSIRFDNYITKMSIFKSGNLIIEFAEINVKNIENTKYKLILLDNELSIINDSLYMETVSNLALIEGSSDGRMFSIKVPFAPQMVWKIIGNKLYVGYNERYEISVFDENGIYLKGITKKVKRQKVTSSDKENWIEEVLEKYKNRPQFSLSIMKKSLENVDIPHYKPAFTKISEFIGSLLIFEI